MIAQAYRRLLARIRYNRRFAGHPGILRITEDTLKLERYCLRDSFIEFETVWSFRWSEVRRICAFKRDVGGFDLICLAFEVKDRAVEMNEGMEGYDSVRKSSRHISL